MPSHGSYFPGVEILFARLLHSAALRAVGIGQWLDPGRPHLHIEI